MEIKEYLEIIKKERKFFIGVVSLVVFLSWAFFFFKEPFYQVSLSLNVTRAGSQDTSEYKYDDYYRLQADEKFVETVVQWLKDPRIVSSIYENSGINTQKMNIGQLGKSIKSEKLSSQIISVSSAKEEKTAEMISASITKILSENTKNLNKDQKEQTWFEIVTLQPVIKKYEPNYAMILFFSFAGGIFLGFWIAMFRHYFR